MKWQCEYHDSKGGRCDKPATIRIHFAKDHPFDKMDLCEDHFDIHPGYVWFQNIEKEYLSDALYPPQRFS